MNIPFAFSRLGVSGHRGLKAAAAPAKSRHREGVVGLVSGLAAVCVLLGGAEARAQTNLSLPTYHVTQSGATATQASGLANFLGIDPALVTPSVNGLVSYFDPSNYLVIPTLPADPVVASNLVAHSHNEFPATPLEVSQIDFGSLSNIMVLDDTLALDLTTTAFGAVGLNPQFGTPRVRHATLDIYNLDGSVVVNSQRLNTEVTYQFTEPTGHPMIGPGAQVHVAFDANGNATAVHYAARQYTTGPSVQIIPPDVAISRVANLFPAGTSFSDDIDYICPPYFHWPWPCLCPPPPEVVDTIIPYYRIQGTMLTTNPFTGVVSNTLVGTQFIPATDDTNFVPSLSLAASTQGGGTQVFASTSVTGGRAPYQFTWSGSGVTSLSNSSPTLVYTPRVRLAPPTLTIGLAGANNVSISWIASDLANYICPNGCPPPYWLPESSSDFSVSNSWTPVTQSVQTNGNTYSVTLPTSDPVGRLFRLRLASATLPSQETVSVMVTDANGVTVQAWSTVSVQATPVVPSAPDAADDFGTESAFEPGFGAADAAAWRTAMLVNGGGPERFHWTSPTTWEGDFIDPPVPHTLPPSPQINGDDDFLNWGIDAANIVLYIGSGTPFSLNFTVTPPLVFNNPALTHSWGDDRDPTLPPALGDGKLDWLGLLSDQTLDDNAMWILTPIQRWSKAFEGLHSVLGFTSPVIPGTGFPAFFANNLLVADQKVYLAWWTAAMASGAGTPAAMGPIGLGFVSDFNDQFWPNALHPWRKVGPRIPSVFYINWWYLHL
jgi:hypothetical protein